MMESGLTTREVAEKLNVADVTVRLWCRQGRFPNAQLIETSRGGIWFIPKGDLNNFKLPLPGRPAKKVAAKSQQPENQKQDKVNKGRSRESKTRR